MSNAPESDNDPGTLPDIDFRSPGRFAIHNPPVDAGEPSSTLEPAPYVLGQHPALLRCDSPAELRSHALALTQQARHTLCLLSPDLEPWLYDQRAISEACRHLLRAHPRHSLRILLRDSSLAVRNGHVLLRLARQLTSNCRIRKLPGDYPVDDGAYLLVDDCGLLLRNTPQLQAAQIHYRDPQRVRQLQRRFDQAWEAAGGDPDLRSFLL